MVQIKSVCKYILEYKSFVFYCFHCAALGLVTAQSNRCLYESTLSFFITITPLRLQWTHHVIYGSKGGGGGGDLYYMQRKWCGEMVERNKSQEHFSSAPDSIRRCLYLAPVGTGHQKARRVVKVINP